MASPLGHTLISTYFLRPHARVTGRKPGLYTALFLMVLASFPDLDVFFGPHEPGSMALFHRTLTHSFFFAIWLGCLIALIESAFDKEGLLKRAALYSALVATHPFIDYFTVVPPYLGAMPLFWPFSGNFYASPVALLPSATTYQSYCPARDSLLKTFASEAVLGLPFLAYEGMIAWRAAKERAVRLETAPVLESLQA